MKKTARAAALFLALLLAAGAAAGEGWRASEKNIPRFSELITLLGETEGMPDDADTAAADAVLEAIRAENADDYDVARAVADHWYAAVCDPDYRMFVYRGAERAVQLERSGLDFSGKHAFVVLGYRLENGEMAPELAGRCDAAAAAARSFPDAVLICTGGATGSNNPDRHTEAGEMKEYLAEACGIGRSRIYTDTEARTTTDNAANVLRIMRELGIESYTLVTSDYHQRWAQVLFNAMAAMYAAGGGYTVRMTGNYNYPAQGSAAPTAGCLSALKSLVSLFRKGIPPEQ